MLEYGVRVLASELGLAEDDEEEDAWDYEVHEISFDPADAGI
jgi:hypothetical protein